MELFDYYMEFLLMNSVIKLDEWDKIHNSIKRAVYTGQYIELKDDGVFYGFVSWETRPSKEKDKVDVGLTNLVIVKNLRGQYPLHRLKKLLLDKYNVDKFIWLNRRKKRLFESKQGSKLCLSTS